MRAKDVREKNAMRAVRPLVVAVLAFVVFAASAAAQSPVGVLAVDERQGDQYGFRDSVRCHALHLEGTSLAADERMAN